MLLFIWFMPLGQFHADIKTCRLLMVCCVFHVDGRLGARHQGNVRWVRFNTFLVRCTDAIVPTS